MLVPPLLKCLYTKTPAPRRAFQILLSQAPRYDQFDRSQMPPEPALEHSERSLVKQKLQLHPWTRTNSFPWGTC